MNPNIVLITADQMRRDCLGVMGHADVETPNLDAMKKYGHMFTRAYSATPSCVPARAALLTGLTQRSHGRVGYQDGVPWKYPVTLPGEFAGAGYHTQCVGKMHVSPARSLCGFHNVVLHDGYLHHQRSQARAAGDSCEATDDYLQWLRAQIGPQADLIDDGLECNSWMARPFGYAEHLHPTHWTVTQSIDFLRRRDPAKPFFLMTSFVRPHAPLDPPQVYYDMYIRRDLRPPLMGDWAQTEDPGQEALDTSCAGGILHERALHRARAAYYGLITHIDAQIGRLLQALAEHDARTNTIVLFTSDHGDLLGDHNLFRKTLPYEGSAGVPFLIYDPGKLLGERQNSTYGSVVELRDVMPTLLDAAGIDIPPCVEGKSVLPLLRDAGAPWRPYIHGEHCLGDCSVHYITDGKRKYIWFSHGREQFFDLEADPGELHDLIGDACCQKQIACCRAYLAAELAGREEGYSDGERLIAGRPPQRCLRRG